MQTLGLSDSTPRTEGRLKALLWPVIRNDADFNYVTEQGFWVCVTVAVLTLVVSVFKRSFLAGSFDAAFYFLAGLGVRQRSKVAAFSAFSAYLLGSFELQRLTGNGFGFPRIVLLAYCSRMYGAYCFQLDGREPLNWTKVGSGSMKHCLTSYPTSFQLSSGPE